MSSLQATLILGDPENPVLHILAPVIPGRYASVREFRSVTELHDGNSVVQRGVLLEDDGSSFPTVCKFAYGKNIARLKHEAELYEDPHHLQSLQGRHVPKFYGYYEGSAVAQGTETNIGCMLLEDCGRRIAFDQRIVYETQCKIVNALLHLHHVGHLEHGDLEFDFRHILLNKADESIRIIDFDHAVKHDCEHTIPVDFFGYQPQRQKFNCPELYMFFIRLGVWTPVNIRFIGRPFHIFRAPTVRRLMKFADHYHPKKDNSYLIPIAEKALDDYYQAYSNRFSLIGHPLQHKLPLNLPGAEDEESDDEKMPPFKPEVDWCIINL